jgi:hypothetical protein
MFIRYGTALCISLLNTLNLHLFGLQYFIVALALCALQYWEQVMVYSLVPSNVRTFVSFHTDNEMTYRALAQLDFLDMVTVRFEAVLCHLWTIAKRLEPVSSLSP